MKKLSRHLINLTSLALLILTSSCGDTNDESKNALSDLSNQNLPLIKESEPQEVKVEILLKDERKKEDSLKKTVANSINEGATTPLINTVNTGSPTNTATNWPTSAQRSSWPTSYANGYNRSNAYANRPFMPQSGVDGAIVDNNCATPDIGVPGPGIGGPGIAGAGIGGPGCGGPGFGGPGFGGPGLDPGIGLDPFSAAPILPPPIVGPVPFVEDILFFNDDDDDHRHRCKKDCKPRCKKECKHKKKCKKKKCRRHHHDNDDDDFGNNFEDDLN